VNSITITIPIPHRSLSPNARTHWRAKAVKVKAARRAASVLCVATVGHGHMLLTNAISTVVWYAKTATHPDPDNALAMLKPYFDGMADAGVLANDRNLAHNPIRFEKDKANPRVQITITRLGGEEAGK
jgi:Holliday junction resolvase RusA-like endonuclease